MLALILFKRFQMIENAFSIYLCVTVFFLYHAVFNWSSKALCLLLRALFEYGCVGWVELRRMVCCGVVFPLGLLVCLFVCLFDWLFHIQSECVGVMRNRGVLTHRQIGRSSHQIVLRCVARVRVLDPIMSRSLAQLDFCSDCL